MAVREGLWCRLGLALPGAVLAGVLVAPPGLADVSKVEAKCAKVLSKEAQKLATKVYRELSRCRTSAIAGKGTAICPTPRSVTKIQAAVSKLTDGAIKHCGSVCSASGSLACLSSSQCPPHGPNGQESCSAGSANKPFEMSNLGFPGPLCEIAIGRRIEAAADLAECVSALVQGSADTAIYAVTGGLPADAGLTGAATACLRALADASGKYMRSVFKASAKCHDGILRGKKVLNPVTCLADDAKLSAKVASAERKFRDVLALRCTNSAVSALDLCGNGVAATTTVDAAADCLVAMVSEVVDSDSVPALRRYSPVSLVETVYPPAARCGDNMVNQLPNPFLLLGEECDGIDDGACPGQCLPPGDLFECTCANVPRMRFFASAEGSETDAGWTGLSHNQLTADLSGYVVELSGCNCTSFNGATCTGSTTDAVCNISGKTKAVCSHAPASSLTCDQFGDNDGTDEAADCAICDAFSANAGAPCARQGDCQSRCYDSDGIATAPCAWQSQCGPGQVCRGRCDTSQNCIRTPNGGPFPVNSAGAAVCGVQTFRTDITGTTDIVTGTHEIYYQLFSQIHTGENLNRPCPVCGGFCLGGANANQICAGSCSDSGGSCRFDEDCPSGELCTTESADCPGGFCELSLVCGADPAFNPQLTGKACRITAEHAFFGTISNDCLPSPTSNTTGRGLEINYLPWTSGLLSLAPTLPCTAPGFELYECPCSDDGGQPSKPNECTPACNAPGPNFGTGCADGNSSGEGTRCAGGVNAGRLCDDDTDCPSSSCSANPRHCVGDPSFARFSCSSNGDCGLGTCVNACPGGRCVPLCVPAAGDPFDGQCAAGPPTYHCDGQKYLFKSCTKSAAGAGCSSVCSTAGTDCLEHADCPAGETCQGACPQARDCAAGADGVTGTADDFSGAGRCVEDIRPCFTEPILAQGGSTLNAQGDPTNMSTVGLFCQKKSINTGANNGAGFGGPTRVRVRGVNVPNFSSIP